jgi:eukaryotic-like serine/threonine-protein kinase
MQGFGKIPKKAESPPRVHLYEFGPFALNPLKRIALRNGEPLALTPKCFDILLMFVERPGEVLVKEELLESIWPDTVVEEGNLNRNISTIRKVLGESPNDHRYIVTVPGRGYRFVAEVREGFEECPQLARREQRSPSNGDGAELSPPVEKKSVIAPIPIPAPAIVRPRQQVRERKIGYYLAWLTVGAAAFALALMLWLKVSSRPNPALGANDSVLIADFSNATGDPVFDDTLKQAISVELSQSPYLDILSDAKVDLILKLMTKPADTRLTPEVARDLCQRAGCKAYITGSIARLGNQYVMTLDALNCQTGDVLAREQVTAAGKEQVLRQLSAVGTKLRTKLGESLSTVQRFDTPLEQTTTPSLEALQAFSAGNLARDRKGDAVAVPLYKRAIELDPKFTMAYDALGLAYSNLDEPKLATENITKAFELRERGSEREKFQITANFSQMVTGDLEKANQICEPWTQLYPRDSYPHNLLGVNYEFLGQYDKALAEMREAARLNPEGTILHSDIMEDYTALNNLEAAKKEYEQTLEKKLDHPYLHADRYGIAFLENDSAERGRQLAWATGRAGAEDFLLSLESDTQAYAGKLADARELSRRAVESARGGDQNETAALWQANAALREAEVGNSDRARKEAEAALVLAPSRDVQVLASLAIARSGDSNRSQKIAEELSKNFPQNTVINGYWLPTIRAAIAIDRGEAAKALDALRAATPYELGYPNPQAGVGRYLYPVYVRAQAYLLTHRYYEATAEYQKILDHPSLTVNTTLGALARLGLARARAKQGDAARASSEYEKFFALWKIADPDIPILKRAKAEYSSLPKI